MNDYMLSSIGWACAMTGTFDQARHICFERLSQDQFVAEQKVTHVQLLGCCKLSMITVLDVPRYLDRHRLYWNVTEYVPAFMSFR